MISVEKIIVLVIKLLQKFISVNHFCIISHNKPICKYYVGLSNGTYRRVSQIGSSEFDRMFLVTKAPIDCSKNGHGLGPFEI